MNERLSCWLPLVGLVISACSAGDPSDPDVSSPESASVPERTSGAEESYVILYKDHAVPSEAAATVEAAGGKVVAEYPAIGVVVARSSAESFSEELLIDGRVSGVSGTSGLASALDFGEEAPSVSTSDDPPPASWGDPLSGLQWNMTQIHAPEAQAINPGSSSVVAGVLDSGIDVTHPDLATQIDASASVSCVGGVANPDPDVWGLDFIGHGTHVAGIIAGAANGIGIVGVAPGVRVAAIQIVDGNGFVFPEDFICGLTWAADHGLDLANASLFIDPWYLACKSDPTQRAVLQAVQRAVEYATAKGTTLIAATGNNNDDLGHPTVDFLSPTTAPTTREVNNSCEVLPVEVAGVVGVSSVGATQLKAFYSNYGTDAVDVTGPGGDFLVITPEAETGQVVSALPPDSLFYFFAKEFFGTAYEDCSSGTCVTYGGLQGTSMAAPHATGVAALAISRHGKMTPDALASILKETATALPCPPNPYDPAPDFVLPATCTGGTEHNNFYGSGEVDALAVVE